MDKKEERWTMKEISVASGIKDSTLHCRRKSLGIPANREGYTLQEVKALIKRPPLHRGKFSQRKADALKRILLNDGAL